MNSKNVFRMVQSRDGMGTPWGPPTRTERGGCVKRCQDFPAQAVSSET